MSRRALGRGLKALIPQVEEDDVDVKSIDLEEIRPNPKQPRRHFGEEELAELSASIKEHGVLEPIIVRPVDGGYELVVGERRWRAAGLAGLKSIPAFVREMDERTAMEIALVENLQREDLNPVEEAQAYRRLIDEFGLKQEEVAIRVGKERSTVTNRLRLLELEEPLLEALRAGRLTAGHAKALLGVEDRKLRRAIAERTMKDGLSVRQVEALARGGRRPKSSRREPVVSDPNLLELQEELQRRLGTKVRVVQGSRGTGRIEIEFYGNEDMDRILAALRGAD